MQPSSRLSIVFIIFLTVSLWKGFALMMKHLLEGTIPNGCISSSSLQIQILSCIVAAVADHWQHVFVGIRHLGWDILGLCVYVVGRDGYRDASSTKYINRGIYSGQPEKFFPPSQILPFFWIFFRSFKLHKLFFNLDKSSPPPGGEMARIYIPVY